MRSAHRPAVDSLAAHRKVHRSALAFVLALPGLATGAAPVSSGTPAAKDGPVSLSDGFQGLAFRNIGPFRGGRVTAVSGVRGDRLTYYFGGTGGGVRKSTDAGATRRNVGLPDSRQISRVRVHPKDPEIAWVAVQGHSWGPNGERGIYRTTDGGKSWKRVLFVDEKTRALDLALDPVNPRILYAAFWQVVRRP